MRCGAQLGVGLTRRRDPAHPRGPLGRANSYCANNAHPLQPALQQHLVNPRTQQRMDLVAWLHPLLYDTLDALA